MWVVVVAVDAGGGRTRRFGRKEWAPATSYKKTNLMICPRPRRVVLAKPPSMSAMILLVELAASRVISCSCSAFGKAPGTSPPAFLKKAQLRSQANRIGLGKFVGAALRGRPCVNWDECYSQRGAATECPLQLNSARREKLAFDLSYQDARADVIAQR